MIKNVKGIAMIIVFLAFWYASKNVEFFTDLSGVTRIAVLVGVALIAYIILDIIFDSRNGVDLKRYIVPVAASVLFIGISLLLEKANVSENIIMIVWFAIPVGLIIYTSKPVQRFLRERKNRNKEE